MYINIIKFLFFITALIWETASTHGCLSITIETASTIQDPSWEEYASAKLGKEDNAAKWTSSARTEPSFHGFFLTRLIETTNGPGCMVG